MKETKISHPLLQALHQQAINVTLDSKAKKKKKTVTVYKQDPTCIYRNCACRAEQVQKSYVSPQTDALQACCMSWVEKESQVAAKTQQE